MKYAAMIARPFRFFPDCPAREAEYQDFQKEDAAAHMALAALLGTAVVLGFYILDTFTIGFGWIGGVQTTRLAVSGVLIGLICLCVFKRSLILRNYTWLANTCFFLGVQAALYIGYASRANRAPAEFYWGITSSGVTGIIVAFGASKLHSNNTLLMAMTAWASALGYAIYSTGGTDTYLGRMMVHIMTSTIVCFLLRRAVEKREMQLFLRIKDHERAEAYAQRLEEARKAADDARLAAEKAKLAAEEADRSKSKFLASMSHEIRTPMHGVLKILELASKNAPEATRRMLAVGHKSGQALLSIFNEILDYTAATSGQSRVEAVPLDLLEAIGTTEKLHISSAHAKGLRLQVDAQVPADARFVKGSRLRLLGVWNNLVGNAIKFTDAGRVHVTLTAQRQGADTAFVLVVRDTGIGIKADDVPKLFTPFWQADQSFSRRHNGTGLGLALSKALITSMGGSIAIESVEGVGTKVTVTLKLATASEAEVGIHEASTPTPTNVPLEPHQDLGPAANPARTVLPLRAMDGGAHTSTSGKAPASKSRGASSNLHVVELSEAEAMPLPPIPTPIAGPLSGHVLLAEDNPLNAMLAAHHLSSLGLSVEVAADGEEAVRMFESHSFDLVLMDLQMPRVDGLEATRRIRAFEKIGEREGLIPIVAWTAHRAQTDVARCRECGMDGFLEKPYDLETLQEQLLQWLPNTPKKSPSGHPNPNVSMQ